MKVQAISNTNFRNLNNVNFSGRKNKESGNGVTDVIRSKAAAVPVVVLLAANPATLNSAIPAQPLEGNRIEAAQTKSADPEIEKATFTDFPAVKEAQQSKAPFGYAYFLKYYEPVKAIQSTVYSSFLDGNVTRNLIFAKQGREHWTDDWNTQVNSIFYIPANPDWKDDDPEMIPPEVEELIYHKDAQKGNYYTVKTSGREPYGHVWCVGEADIDEKTAKILLDFIKFKEPFGLRNCSTGIEYRETTEPKMKTKFYK